jgi:hypothetical protein
VAGRRDYSEEELQAAVQRLTEPGRLDAAQRLVVSRAPQLQQILNQALDDSEWFGPAHLDEIRKATSQQDPHQRQLAVRTLIAEETRLTMLVGVAVGLELAHLLDNPQEDQT